ncbi:MAG: terminase TerL endonuclease subunit [Paludibacteraceae bacterium]
MKTNDELKAMKARVLDGLRRNLPVYKARLCAIDGRLYDYCADAIREDMDTANVYELLGIRKVLRLMDSYELNGQHVQRMIRAIEGVWDTARGCHIKGGLMFSTPRGRDYVRLMPYQVWCLFGIYGFLKDVCMGISEENAFAMLPSEYVLQGMVWDKRRLTDEAHIFQTRKSGKTEFGAAIDFVEANILGDKNAQVLICTNSKEQSKIAYKAVKEFAYQLDPAATSKAGGRYLRVTADEMTWMPGRQRSGEIKVMSAGGKKKDGLYASLVHADEHGSAAYVNNHSDMQSLVEVCAGSMGPRREKLLLHTTTAGLVNMGPYQLQLQTVEQLLEREADYPYFEVIQTEEDHWFAFLLRLDPWEVNLEPEDLDHEHLFRKVNRSIGITVQPTWYHERLQAARKSEDTRKEVLTKDFNIWQTDKKRDWFYEQDIRRLQVPVRIGELSEEDGWVMVAGGDFSQWDDGTALAFLAKNTDTGEYFADAKVFISERALRESPNKELYSAWVQQGWMEVCAGNTVDEQTVTNALMKVTESLNLYGFGYDAYDSDRFINNIKAWIFTQGGNPDQLLIPVAQNYATYNGPVQDMSYMVMSDPPLIHFSMSPLWVWEFLNVKLAVSNDGMDNVKPVKANANAKVDLVQSLLSALHILNRLEGKVG